MDRKYDISGEDPSKRNGLTRRQFMSGPVGLCIARHSTVSLHRGPRSTHSPR